MGYTGGETLSPTYGSVCANDGHTEALQLRFDPAVVSFEKLLDLFFASHNPARRAKSQYKSALWWHTPEQEAAVRSALDKLAARGISVATTVGPAQAWWPAEERHQKYLEKQGWKKRR